MATTITVGKTLTTRPYVARIVGPHPTYRLDRQFVRGDEDYSGSGKTGTLTVTIADPGVYEISGCQWWTATQDGSRVDSEEFSGRDRGTRTLIEITDDGITRIDSIDAALARLA